MKKNFLPAKYNKGVMKEFVYLFSIINVVILLTFGVIYFYSTNSIEKMEVTILQKEKIIEQQLQENLVKKSSNEENIHFEEVTSRIVEGTNDISSPIPDSQLNSFFYNVHEALNNQISLSYVSHLSDNEILIRGQAVDYIDLHSYYKKLLETVFESAEITDILVHPLNGTENFALREVVYFEIKGVAKNE